MTPAQFTKQLANIVKEIDDFARKDAPTIVGKVAIDHFKENFHKEGFVNDGLHEWAEVNRRTGGKINKKGRYVKNYAKGADRSRKILTGRSGILGDSFKAQTADNSVTIYTNVPYAAAHNEGTKTAGRNRNVTLPKRQFMGESKELDEKIINEINRKLKSITQ